MNFSKQLIIDIGNEIQKCNMNGKKPNILLFSTNENLLFIDKLFFNDATIEKIENSYFTKFINDIPIKPKVNINVENSFKFNEDQIPENPFNKKYDMVIIDGPEGYSNDKIGRLMPIYWAKNITNMIYIDDADRKLEKYCIDKFYKGYLKEYLENAIKITLNNNILQKKILVVQTDDRELTDYLLLSYQINNKQSDNLNYLYKFIRMDKKYFKNRNPKYGKIWIINEILSQNEYDEYDMIVFLDMDAWINNYFLLEQLLIHLNNFPNKHGCFSRDPYLKINTYINSGSFIIKCNDYIRNMYSNIINVVNSDPTSYTRKWPNDQYYISDFVFNNKDDFIIYNPNVINSPDGIIIRHNWYKNAQMYEDMKTTLETMHSLSKIKYKYFNFYVYDKEIFPNNL